MKYLTYIIEDSPKAGAQYLRALRASADFDAELFTNMEDANAAAEKRRPHILLADIRLDESDATEYLAHVRAGDTNFDNGIPVALFTRDLRDLMDETVKRAVSQGASALLVKDKDIDPSNAASVLLRLINGRHENDDVIMALRRIKEQSDEQTLRVLPAGGGENRGLTLDDVIQHMQLNDDFARKFRAGLNSVSLTLLQGDQQAEK